MTLHLTELQQITLRDVFTTAGLTARQGLESNYQHKGE